MITPSFNLTATERVLPSMALDFTTASLDSRITFTRTTGASNPATYVGSDGYIASASNNQARFDYDPVTLACKGLLIEEARTNLFTYSSDYTNDWTLTKLTSFGTTTSPDNTNTGYKLVPNTDSATHSVSQTIALTSGTTYTFSVYAKAAEKTNLQLRISTTNDIQITFNVDTGEIKSTVAGTGTITDVGNGWYRCTATATCTSTASLALRIYVAEGDNTTLTYAGNDVDGLYIWGAQLEVGAFPTSYIPTTTAALTRNADVATMTGTNFSDWYNQSQGTLFQQSIVLSTSGTKRLFNLSDGTDTNRIYLGAVSSGAFTVVNASSFEASLSAGAVTANTMFKTTGTYNTNYAIMATNAMLSSSDTSVTLPTLSQANLGSNGNATSFMNGWLQKVSYWPTQLTSAEVRAFSK